MGSYAWREVARRRHRSILTTATVLVAVALLVSVWGVLRSLRGSVARVFEASRSDMTVTSFAEPGPYERARLARHLGPIPAATVAEVAALPGVKLAAGQLHFWAWMADERAMTAAAGLDPALVGEIGPLSMDIQTVAGRLLQPGDRRTVVVDVHYADQWHVEVGETVELAGREFTVVGVVRPTAMRAAEAEVYLPLADAQELMAVEQSSTVTGAVINTILVRVADLGRLGALEQEARRLVTAACEHAHMPAAKVMVFTTSRIFSQATGISALAAKAAQVVALIVLIAMVLVVVRAAVGTVSERTAEIGVLRASGWRADDVTCLFATELGLQGVVGGVLGVLLGEWVVYGWTKVVSVEIPNAMNPFPCVPSIPMPTEVPSLYLASPAFALGALGLAVFVCVASGLLAARRATRLEPMVALRRI